MVNEDRRRRALRQGAKFRLAQAQLLFGPAALHVFQAERLVDPLQAIVRAPQGLGGAPFGCRDPHDVTGEGGEGEQPYGLYRRVARQTGQPDVIISEGQDGQRRRERPRFRSGEPGRDDDRREEQGNGSGGLPAGLHQEQSRECGSHRQNGYGVADQHGPLGGFERIENQHASASRLGVMGAIRGVEPRAELLARALGEGIVYTDYSVYRAR